MAEDTAAFPRGSLNLQPLKNIKQQQQQQQSSQNKSNKQVAAENDFLFGTKKPSAKKAKTYTKVDAAAAAKFDKKLVSIEPLSFNKLEKGVKLLAGIRQVEEDFTIVSLPGNLSGYIRRKPNTPSHKTLFSSNQIYLPVAVVKAVSENGKKRIEVTPATSTSINQQGASLSNGLAALNNDDSITTGRMVVGIVQSLEDHGALVKLVISGTSVLGFLPYKNIEGYSGNLVTDGEEESDDESSNDESEVGSESNEGEGNGDSESEEEGNEGDDSESSYTINAASKASKQAKLRMGQVLTLLIDKAGENNSNITLKLPLPATLAKQMEFPNSKSNNRTIQSIIPGAKVDCKIINRAKNGLIVKFAGVFQGAIEENHLGSELFEGDEWKKSINFQKSMSLQARILSVDPATKAVRLTLLPHLLNLQAPPPFPSYVTNGAILENKCKVLRIDRGIGTLVGFVDEEESFSRLVYVHISKAADSENADKSSGKKRKLSEIVKTDLNKVFKVGSVVPKLRILNYSQSLIEGFASGCTAKSAVSGNLLMNYDDLEIGKVYRAAEILDIKDSGVLVSLGNGIKAFCTNMHLSDLQSVKQLSALKQKMKVGKKLDSVKVISVESDAKRCMVTMKKSLLQDKLPPALSYDIQKGTKCVGFISQISSKGVAVTFYNNIYGFITAKALAQGQGVEDPVEAYSLGQTMRCKVQKYDTKRRSLLLKPEAGVDEDDDDDGMEVDVDPQPEQLNVGTILEKGVVVKMHAGSTGEKSHIPGYAIVHFTEPAQIECKLGYDHLFDEYKATSNNELNGMAKKLLKVGKPLGKLAVVISSSEKSTLITVKPKIVSILKKDNDAVSSILPSDASSMHVGSVCLGTVTRIDEKYGAFVRFFNGLTGIIPKLKDGCKMPLYDTILCKVVALDVSNKKKPKILLRRTKKGVDEKKVAAALTELKVGDKIGPGRVENVNFQRANITFLDSLLDSPNLKCRIHFTLAKNFKPLVKAGNKRSSKSRSETSAPSSEEEDARRTITVDHPFWSWSRGDEVEDLRVVSKETRDSTVYLEVTNIPSTEKPAGVFYTTGHLKPQMLVSGIVCEHHEGNEGLFLQVSAEVRGFISGLELSKDPKVLNNLEKYFPVGTRLDAVVKSCKDESSKGRKREHLDLSVLLIEDLNILSEKDVHLYKPKVGDVVVGRINRMIESRSNLGSSLMLNLRGSHRARCCITELAEIDDWENMPLGSNTSDDKSGSEYRHGKYVSLKILGNTKGCFEASMRESRIEGDIDEDEIPEEGENIRAYIKETTKRGCFLTISRNIEGRVLLKDLSDGFVPDPASEFPRGRLVVANIKKVNKTKKTTNLDLDMRESSLYSDGNMLKFEVIQKGEKYKGIVSRIERYGVFVKLDDSDIRGLVHLSECSDKFVSDVSKFFVPGDRVKVLVLNKDDENKKVDLSMKSSHFADDEDSSDSEAENDEESDEDLQAADSEGDSNGDDDDDKAESDDSDDNSFDSDDENFMSKLAGKVQNDGSSSEDTSVADGSEGEANGDDSSSDSDDEVKSETMDEDEVGFDWGGDSMKKRKMSDDMGSDSSDDESSDESVDKAGGHKSRKKAAKKRKEEAEVAEREAQLADGRADENPESAADFERLLAGEPNSSEIYMRYMAHYLSLSDIDAARRVAERAFQRIEFREEVEKLNVWSALMALEMKYGNEDSFNSVVERAANQNNPKQVYIRCCEMLEKEVDKQSSSSIKSKSYLEAKERTDNMCNKMCKKFRSKKTVWTFYMRYLLKHSRHNEAHKVLKRAIQSLPAYKHVETSSRLAQMEYEYGSSERARTIFNTLVENNKKRLDLLFVYVDKELKHGGIKGVRDIMQQQVNISLTNTSSSRNDRQMKKLFKKWLRMEEEFGDEESQKACLEEAAKYVERTSS